MKLLTLGYIKTVNDRGNKRGRIYKDVAQGGPLSHVYSICSLALRQMNWRQYLRTQAIIPLQDFMQTMLPFAATAYVNCHRVSYAAEGVCFIQMGW